jgi:hypothetical protein
LLACQWHRLAQEEAVPGRAAEAGDDLGSRLVAARLAEEVMRLAFLLARQYRPYAKWFGTAFGALPSADRLERRLARVLDAADAVERERALAALWEAIAAEHNSAAVTDPLDPTTRAYHSREFPVLLADRFADACVDRISDPWLRALPLIGSVDQFAASTDLLSRPDRVNRLVTLYETQIRPE